MWFIFIVIGLILGIGVASIHWYIVCESLKDKIKEIEQDKKIVYRELCDHIKKIDETKEQ